MSKQKITMSKEQATEMYYQINSYYLFLQSAVNVDKCFFVPIKFWNGQMNMELNRARNSAKFLLDKFNQHFKPKDNDLVQYEAPSELYRVMDFFSRLSPDSISQIMDELEEAKENKLKQAV